MHPIEISRQQYLDIIHCYLQSRLSDYTFRTCLWDQWAEERDALWHTVWQATRTQRCQEREQLEKGETPCAELSDPRRLLRMMDRFCTLCFEGSKKEKSFRDAIEELLAAYHCSGSSLSEARYIDYPPHIAVFERPLPPGGNHHYPCTVEDIRVQLASVPEYDLEGIWAIGLSPAGRDKRNVYGTYYRWRRSMRKPKILLYSFLGTGEFKLRYRSDPGYIQQWFRVERSYGIEIEHTGSYVVCRWNEENGRRYIVEHVLLHEIGHHVQLRQRWRAGLCGWLPTHFKEQFAEDYAIRFNRERKI